MAEEKEVKQVEDTLNDKLMKHEVTLKYTVGDLNNILLALGDLPFVKVQNIVTGIHNQVQPSITKFLEENKEPAVEAPETVQ